MPSEQAEGSDNFASTKVGSNYLVLKPSQFYLSLYFGRHSFLMFTETYSSSVFER
tara:strand:- start:1396 stop:1560 length:165 start_codon:yes stop_codon:yes gene_type:complete